MPSKCINLIYPALKAHMSKIKDLETTQLRQVYYLLSIDLVEVLKNIDKTSKINSAEITHKICVDANDLFGIVLEANEIQRLFITPLINHLDSNTLDICSEENGRYGLTNSHFEFTSSLSVFINATAKI